MARLWKAFLNSLAGLAWGLRREAALRQEIAVLAVALPVGYLIAPNPAWWLAMIGALLVLIMVELLNTAIEKLSDHVTPEHHHAIKVVKDLGSAAVFFGLVLAGMVWIAAMAVRLLG